MADLEHLLDALDQPEQDVDVDNDTDVLRPSVTDDHEAQDEQQPPPNENDDHSNDNDNDDDAGVMAAVPPTLLEAQQPRTTMGTTTTTTMDRLELDDVVDDNHNNAMDDHDIDNRGQSSGNDSSSQQYQAYLKLMRWWKTEVHAPDLQPWQGQLMRAWQHTLDDAEAAAEEEEAGTAHQHDANAAKRALLRALQRTDRNRLQFVVQHLLACRLQKIQRYHGWLVQELQLQNQNNKDGDNEDNDDMDDHDTPRLLSGAERQFCLDYHQLWQGHLQQTVTSHVGQSVWKALDEPDMITAPDIEQFVWVKFRRASQLSFSQSQFQSQLSQPQDFLDDDWHQQNYEAGTVLVLPYRNVQELVADGTVELIL